MTKPLTNSSTNSSTKLLTVLPIPAFENNYLWLIHDGTHAVVIDPGDAAPVLAALMANKLVLRAILLTHRHADHIGGVADLLQCFKVPVFGPRYEAIKYIDYRLMEGDTVRIPELCLDFFVLDVPGHTPEHIAYFAPAQRFLFCGDALFAGGCGYLFPDFAVEMAASLNKLATLPDETLVYCAHEYTLANLQFAHLVEPENTRLNMRIQEEKNKRIQGQPTIPSTIGLEKATNPFLRHAETAIMHRLKEIGRLDILESDPVASFVALREWKNTYR